MFVLFFLSFSFMSAAVVQAEPVADSYIAAVYEHVLIQNPDPRVPVTRSAALQHMQKNLDVYEEQAARAAQQVRCQQVRGCWVAANFSVEMVWMKLVFYFLRTPLIPTPVVVVTPSNLKGAVCNFFRAVNNKKNRVLDTETVVCRS